MRRLATFLHSERVEQLRTALEADGLALVSDSKGRQKTEISEKGACLAESRFDQRHSILNNTSKDATAGHAGAEPPWTGIFVNQVL
jgi:hypothetical protein